MTICVLQCWCSIRSSRSRNALPTIEVGTLGFAPHIRQGQRRPEREGGGPSRGQDGPDFYHCDGSRGSEVVCDLRVRWRRDCAAATRCLGSMQLPVGMRFSVNWCWRGSSSRQAKPICAAPSHNEWMNTTAESQTPPNALHASGSSLLHQLLHPLNRAKPVSALQPDPRPSGPLQLPENNLTVFSSFADGGTRCCATRRQPTTGLSTRSFNVSLLMGQTPARWGRQCFPFSDLLPASHP